MFASVISLNRFIAIAQRVEISSLPQTVAAFHSLVGISASAAAIGDYMNSDIATLDGVHLSSVYLATVIGSITTTGSLIAFGKLDGRIGSTPLKLELTSSHAGLNKAGGKKALSSTIISSIAALVVIRGILQPQALIGGHFNYGTVGSLTGRTMIITAVACGAGGAFLGTVFHKLVGVIKKIAWTAKIWNDGAKSDNINNNNNLWKRPIFIKTLIGLIVGLISSFYPQTLFWGEGSLQTMISGQQIAFVDTKHGLSHLLTSSALVDPSLPFETAAAAAHVGIAKLFAIALACAGKFPGGE